MNKEKQIEKFISKSIKKGDEVLDELELLNIFNNMTTTEIYSFWSSYSSGKAFSTANTRVDDWKTKEMKIMFNSLSFEYRYYPKEKDVNGKNIIDRIDLIKHVKFHIFKIIKDGIQSNREFKEKSFLERIPFYLLIVTLVVMLPFYLVFSIWDTKYSHLIIFWCNLYYAAAMILYFLISLIVYRIKRNKNPLSNSDRG
jgi:hypothetical protein